ncbi:MAG: signal peptidase I [Candidatus Omnitrophica bacterium]|nr:signal peptidase I [Candidatus Omnitrophota bacterium]MBU4487641.1 signal peptidase I [Candidatus Omnitrophota bacterium]MCG2705026.1 signal peptidase I [Candidatus Omnitrophota bacterium]
MKPHTKMIIREWVESILIAVILALFIRTFFIQAFKIPSGSMRPTLLEGDKIMVNKLLYGPKIPFINYKLPGLREPMRGDIVVFEYPEDRKKDFIKRLIAVGGETIEISNGNIVINGKPIEGPPEILKAYYYDRGHYGVEGNAVVVPEDSYFVLGDNSASSRDSRYWGFVSRDDIIGRAMFIWWPPWRIQKLK